MAIPSGLNRVLDTAHKVAVGVLATSALYFSVEIFRASWAIQETKFEARQTGKPGGSGGDAAAAPPAGGKA